MKTLPLPGGRQALVDDDVWERARQHHWHVHPHGYVWRKIRLPKGKRGGALLCREIVQAPPGFGVLNRNGDQLDNRRENLVLCSPAERATHLT